MLLISSSVFSQPEIKGFKVGDEFSAALITIAGYNYCISPLFEIDSELNISHLVGIEAKSIENKCSENRTTCYPSEFEDIKFALIKKFNIKGFNNNNDPDLYMRSWGYENFEAQSEHYIFRIELINSNKTSTHFGTSPSLMIKIMSKSLLEQIKKDSKNKRLKRIDDI